MFLKLLLIAVITAHALVEAIPKKKSANERVAALLYKDAENGELRFLTGSSTANQLVDQGQNLLEQFRPSNGLNNNITAIIISLNGGGGVPTVGTFSTTGGVGGGNGNAGVANGSPITVLLPQIVAQAVAGGAATSPTYPSSPVSTAVLNRRRIIRPVHRRRRVNSNSGKRRRRRRPANRPQFVLVRPQNG